MEIDKAVIVEACKAKIEARIQAATQAMNEAQQSTLSEDKSSAGDKYETGRAMGHMASELNAKQLIAAKADLQQLQQLVLQTTDQVRVGSLLLTSNGLYFIAIGIGMLELNGNQIAVISPASPLGKILLGLAAGDSFSIQSTKHHIVWVR
jgi:transcription elongation GreA/GreB family factor